MRARHRHFNPAHAGAKMVLDSRFIGGLNDGDAVTTWSDRSSNGNDVTSSGTARPSYQTAELGGQPSVRFDGNDDQMERVGTFISNATSSSPFYMSLLSRVTKANVNNLAERPFTISAGPNQFSAFIGTRLVNSTVVYHVGVSKSGVSDQTILCAAMASVETKLLSLSNLSSSFKAFDNGVEISQQSHNATIISATANSSAFVIGAFNYNGTKLFYSDSDILYAVARPDEISNSLRKRLEHAAAFSFKITCS